MSDKVRFAIVIVGMRCSGASTMADVVGLTGAQQPGDLKSVGSVRCSCKYASPATVQQTEISSTTYSNIEDSTREVETPGQRHVTMLMSQMDDASLVVLRDPYPPIVLSSWRKILVARGYKPVFVLMVRQPEDVALAMRAFDGAPKSEIRKEWIKQLECAERNSRGFDRIFVEIDMLLADWRTVIGRLNRLLGRPELVTDATASAIDHLLRQHSNRHGPAVRASVLSDDPDGAERLFEIARQVAISGVERVADLDDVWRTAVKEAALRKTSPRAHLHASDRVTDAEDPLTWLLISGAPRSGTSLVRAIVSDHPQAALLQEYGLTEFVKRIQAIVDRDEAAEEDWGGAASAASDPLRRAADFYRKRRSHKAVTRGGGDLHSRHLDIVARGIFAALAPGKRIRLVGDKMPMRGPFEDLDHLGSRLEDFRVLIVVRNPLDVVNSSLLRREAARHKLDVWPIVSVQDAVREWLTAWRTTGSIQAEWQGSAMIVKYESVCQDPAGEAAQIFRFLRLPPHQSTIPIEQLPSDISILTPEDRAAILALLGPLIEHWPSLSAQELLAAYGDLPPLYTLGSKVELSSREATPYLKSGFSWREEWGRWTIGPKARLEITHGYIEGRISIELALASVHTSEGETCKVVVCTGNGQECRFIVSKCPALLTLSTDAAASPRLGILDLDLLIEPPPREADSRSDGRAIGVGLASFRVTRA